MFTKLLSFAAPYSLAIVGSALAVSLAATAVQTYRVGVWQDKAAAIQGRCDSEKATAVESALSDARIEAGITAKRLSDLKAKDDEATAKLAKLEADKLIADAATDKLRDRIKAYAAAARSAGSNPAPVATGTQAPNDPIGVLAELSDRLNAASGVFAKYADEIAIRLDRCEAQYDSLERRE